MNLRTKIGANVELTEFGHGRCCLLPILNKMPYDFILKNTFMHCDWVAFAVIPVSKRQPNSGGTSLAVLDFSLENACEKWRQAQ